MFEGDEYSREKVKVKVLKEVGNERGEGNIEGEEVEAETYIWIAGEERLEDSEWDFAEFQKEKMRYWVGAEGVGEYAGRASIIGETLFEPRCNGVLTCCALQGSMKPLLPLRRMVPEGEARMALLRTR